MRVVYLNLHANGSFVTTLDQIITKRHPMSKQRSLIEYLIDNGVEVVDFITYGGSTLPWVSDIKSVFLRKLEAKYVFRKNGYSKNSIKIITDPKVLDEKDIFMFRSTNLPGYLDRLNEVNAIKIVDHLHFYGEKETADKLKDKGIKYYMFEVDLDKYSKLYKKNYSWFTGEFIMRPYSYQPRFKVTRSFNERKTKAVAMGTLTKRPTPEFIETYGTEYYQPHRKMIMDNADIFQDEMDSYISEYQEKPLKEIKDKDLMLVKLYKKIFNIFQSGQQKSYFSFDMVEKYNEYKMFICPEDVNGSYGVGTIEGMACGCAMIGWNYGAFEDMGMVGGIHYIPYDGTMEDLIAKIRLYQRPEMQQELSRIAKTGCEFVRKNFSQDAVAKEYFNNLKKLAEKG